MSEGKICPLLSLLRMEPNGTPCAGGDCAWWDGCQCLLRSAAEQLEERKRCEAIANAWAEVHA